MEAYLENKEKAYTSIRKFLDEPESSNKIITAPTQVGKTASMIELLKNAKGWLSVVSCDNKTDQLSQIVSRFQKAGINVFHINKCKKRAIMKILLHLANKRNVVIVLLNNGAQIKSLSKLIEQLVQKIHIEKYLCIHDEADMVNKMDIIEDVRDPRVPESHRQWLMHFTEFKNFFNKTLRVWVTATCDNCSNIDNITGKDIVVIPPSLDYIPVNKHVDWNGTDETLLLYEIQRIFMYQTGEVILYCYDTRVVKQIEKARILQQETDCITVVYNSTTKCVFGYPEISTFKCIQELLTDLKQINKPVVIFGCEMMGRGMSFVGNDVETPLAATVLFHKDTTSTSAVNMTQKFGRITGTARPDIKTRIVYCTSKAYTDYTNYLYNQQAVYNEFDNYPDLNMTEILGLIDSKRIHRKVDRISLKKVNSEYSVSSRIVPETSSGPSGPVDTVKMHRLVKSWKDTNNLSEIAKLFRLIIENDGKMLSSQVKNILSMYGINYYNNLVAPVNNRWDTVFRKNETHHFIKDVALVYYRSLL